MLDLAGVASRELENSRAYGFKWIDQETPWRTSDKPFRDVLRKEATLTARGEATSASPGSLRLIVRITWGGPS